MIIWYDSQFPPAINDCQQAQMVVRRPLFRHLSKRELIQNLISQKQVLVVSARFEYCSTSSLYAVLELLTMTAQHELEQLRYRFGVLPNLGFCGWVEYGKASVDMPLVGVDPKRYINLYILNTSDVSGDLPGKLLIRTPRRTHAQESSMRNRLSVGRDAVMLLRCEMNVP